MTEIDPKLPLAVAATGQQRTLTEAYRKVSYFLTLFRNLVET